MYRLTSALQHNPEEIKGITVHDKNFCCWKLESCWDKAIFTRQKTYIEHVTHEDLNLIDEPYYNAKCAGMPQKCKDLFQLSMDGNANINGYIDKELNKQKEWSQEEKEFLFNKETREPIKRDFTDFKVGLKVPDKLRPKRIRGLS